MPVEIRLTDRVTLPTVADVLSTRRVRRLEVRVRRTVAVRALRMVVVIRLVARPTAVIRLCSRLMEQPTELVTALAKLLAIEVAMARLLLVRLLTLLSKCTTVPRPCLPPLVALRNRWPAL